MNLSAIGILSGVLLLTPALTAAPGKRAPVIPLSARYTVTTSAQDLESLRAETRLVQFVHALQQGRRQKAAALLSSRIGAPARKALIEKRWLPARTGAGAGFGQLIFWHDIQIRTQRIRGDHRDLVISPRRIPFMFQRHKGRPTGILEVPMLKDQGQWWVDMQPGKI